MKLTFVVSEFPKETETFVLRDALHCLNAGHDVSVFHLKPFRHEAVVHEFAKDVVKKARYTPFVGQEAIVGTLWALFKRPRKVASVVSTIVSQTWRDPKRMFKKLAIVPKSLALAKSLVAEQADHIHAAFAGYTGTSAWVASQISDVPFSMSCHAHDIFISQALLAEKARDGAFLRVISEFNKSFLKEKIPDLDLKKVHVIRCGVNPAMAAAPAPVPPGTSGPLNILYVGSLTAKKGVENLVQALARLKGDIEWQARIVGDGDEAVSLKALALNVLGPFAPIDFVGLKPAEEIFDAYQWAHVVVVPSIVGKEGRMEGIPVVAMEALSHARPLIISKMSGIPELVVHKETGLLVEPGNPNEIAENLSWIRKNWAEAALLGLNGRDQVLRHYDVEKNASALLKLISRNVSASEKKQKPTKPSKTTKASNNAPKKKTTRRARAS